MVIVCYDGSADAQAAADRVQQLFPEKPATVLTVWEPYTATLESAGGRQTGFTPSILVARLVAKDQWLAPQPFGDQRLGSVPEPRRSDGLPPRDLGHSARIDPVSPRRSMRLKSRV
jgi:hypothetical protein